MLLWAGTKTRGEKVTWVLGRQCKGMHGARAEDMGGANLLANICSSSRAVLHSGEGSLNFRSVSGQVGWLDSDFPH